jgi:hypothetical protein
VELGVLFSPRAADKKRATQNLLVRGFCAARGGTVTQP